MTADDPHDRWLREQLDRELEPVRSHPAVLAEILDRGRRLPWWRRRSAGLPAWVVAATAVVAIALAAPVAARLATAPAAQTVLPLATAPLSPALPVTASPTPALPRTTSPAPSTASSRTPVPTRPTPTRSPVTSRPAVAAAELCASTAAPGTTTVSLDLDGDARPDALSYAGGELVVQLSAAGRTAARYTTASPYVSVLPVETDGTPGSEFLLLTRGAIGPSGDVGVDGTLYDVQGCDVAPVPNAQGRPYVFEVGVAGSGDVLAGTECTGDTLYGVTSQRRPDGSYLVTRTPVSSAGGRAVNGTPQTGVEPGSALDQLSSAGCGTAQAASLG